MSRHFKQPPPLTPDFKDPSAKLIPNTRIHISLNSVFVNSIPAEHSAERVALDTQRERVVR